MDTLLRRHSSEMNEALDKGIEDSKEFALGNLKNTEVRIMDTIVPINERVEEVAEKTTLLEVTKKSDDELHAKELKGKFERLEEEYNKRLEDLQ